MEEIEYTSKIPKKNTGDKETLPKDKLFSLILKSDAIDGVETITTTTYGSRKNVHHCIRIITRGGAVLPYVVDAESDEMEYWETFVLGLKEKWTKGEM